MPSPQQAIPQSPSSDDFSDIAQPHDTVDDFADIAQPHTSSLDILTANPKKQGTYRMLAPAGSDIKSGAMIPYGNIQAARKQGFTFDPQSGDDTRFVHDLWTELKSREQMPTLSDEEYQNQYGAIPSPAPGSKDWYKRQGVNSAHVGIDSLPMVGTIAGAVAGSPGLFTAEVGAGAGAAGGEAAKQMLNEKFFGEKLTPKQSAERIGVQGALGTGTEFGSRAFAYPFKAAGKYLGYTAEESAKAGIPLLPSEALGRAPTWAEEFLKGSVLSKRIMERFRETQNKESIAAVDKLMNSISDFKGTHEDLGKMVQKGLDDSEKSFRAEQDILYKAIDDITEKPLGPPTPVNVPLFKDGKVVLDKAGKPVTQTMVQPNLQVMPSMADLKAFAKEQLDKINQPPFFLPKDVAEQSRNAFDTILNNPDKVSFKRMRDMRSVLLTQIRSLDEAMGGSKLGLAKKFESLTDKSIEDAANKSGIPGLAKRWREANDITAETHRIFEQKLVDKAVESEDPEFIAQLLGGKTIGLQQTRDLFKALPEKVYDPVRRGLLNDAVAKATEPRTGAFDEGKFATYVDRLGDEKGNIIFGQNWKNIKELVDIIGKINGPVGLAKGGGAALQNVGIMKRAGGAALSIFPELAALATGAGTGHLGEAFAGVGTEALTARTVAWAMVNPAKAAKMLKYARLAARALPYGPTFGFNVVKPENVEKGVSKTEDQYEKAKDFVKKSAMELVAPPAAPPPSGQAFNHIAINPATGHVIGHDGQNWRDVKTGVPVNA